MPRRTQTETWELWMTRIKEGLRYRHDKGNDAEWKLAHEYFRNEFEEGVDPENMVFAGGTQLVSESVPRRPGVVITALEPGTQAPAAVLSQLMKQLFFMLKLKRELKQSALDSFKCGMFALKFGYDSAYGYDPTQEVPGGGTYTQYGKRGQRIEFFPAAAPGMPWVHRLAPWNLVVPWGTAVLDDAPWIAVRHIRYLEDVKHDTKYRASARSKLQGVSADSQQFQDEDAIPTDEFKPQMEDRHDDLLILWEIFDRRRDWVIVIAEANEGIVLRDEDSSLLSALQAYPVIALPANDNGLCFWGDSDFTFIKTAQHSLNHLFSQFNEHARLQVVRFLINQDLIEPADVNALMTGIPGAGVRIKEGTFAEDLNAVLKSFTPDFPYLEHMAAMEAQRRVIREMLGISQLSMGEHAGPPRRSATEVNVVQAAHVRRIGRRRDLIEEVIVEFARRIARIVFRFWNERQVVKVLGPGSVPYWVQFRGDDLSAEYSYEIEAEDRIPASSEQRRQEALAMIQLLPVLREAGVDARYVVQNLLKHFPEFDANLAMPSPAARGPVGMQEFGDAMAGSPNAALPI